MKKVYLLQHIYQYGKNNEYDEVKVLGIFDSRLKAEEAINFYKVLPGFNAFSKDCFNIDVYELNNLEWQDGFIKDDVTSG